MVWTALWWPEASNLGDEGTVRSAPDSTPSLPKYPLHLTGRLPMTLAPKELPEGSACVIPAFRMTQR